MKKQSYFLLLATVVVVYVFLSIYFKIPAASFALIALLQILKILLGLTVYAIFSLLGFASLYLKYGSLQKARKVLAEDYNNNYIYLAQASLLNLIAAFGIGFVIWVMYKTLGHH